MDMPPSRYRVVEQGRRLVVIDTLAGEPVRPVPASMPEMPGEKRRRMEAPRAVPPRPRDEPRRRYAGAEQFSFVTAPWFDKEGPRTIRVSKNGQTQLGVAVLVALVIGAILIGILGWLTLFVVAFLAINPKARDGVRSAATLWITALDSAEG